MDDEIGKYYDDVEDVIENWCCGLDQHEIDAFDFMKRWHWIWIGFEQLIDYRETKWAQYAPRSDSSRSSEDSDDEFAFLLW